LRSANSPVRGHTGPLTRGRRRRNEGSGALWTQHCRSTRPRHGRSARGNASGCHSVRLWEGTPMLKRLQILRVAHSTCQTLQQQIPKLRGWTGEHRTAMRLWLSHETRPGRHHSERTRGRRTVLLRRAIDHLRFPETPRWCHCPRAFRGRRQGRVHAQPADLWGCCNSAAFAVWRENPSWQHARHKLHRRTGQLTDWAR